MYYLPFVLVYLCCFEIFAGPTFNQLQTGDSNLYDMFPKQIYFPDNNSIRLSGFSGNERFNPSSLSLQLLYPPHPVENSYQNLPVLFFYPVSKVTFDQCSVSGLILFFRESPV